MSTHIFLIDDICHKIMFIVLTFTLYFPGYSKYKIPALEPFYIPKLEIKEGRGAVNLDLTFQKIKIHGLTNGEIQKVV